MEPQGIVKAFRKRKKLRDEVLAAPLKIWKEETKNQQGWLEPITAYVLQAGIGQARAEIFCKQIIHNGGHIFSQFSPDVTHVIVDEDMDFDRAFRLLKLKKLPQGLQLVKASWLTSCITAQQILDTTDFRLIVPDKYLDETGFSVEHPPLLNENKIHPNAENTVMELKEESNTEIRSFCDTVQNELIFCDWINDHSISLLPLLLVLCISKRTLDDEEIEEDKAIVTLEELKALKSGQDLNIMSEGSSACRSPGKWVCARSSESKKINHNQCITEKLEVLAKAYSVQGDKWRGLSYMKAINALKSYHKPVTSYQEACKITGIGKQMAEKIVEILESGHLRKLDHISDNVSVLELFSNIWGAGVKTSQMWYQQGFRTLDDIRTRASLTSQQIIGLKYYEDFLERMPRQEAAEIEQTVREAAQSIIPELMCIACGSFRRGKPTCGDVDVLVTHPDGHSHQGVFNKLLNILHKSGFLKDDLVNQEDNGSQQKYLGVCRLPGQDRRHRRLDIIVVPYREFACALLYFTGSAHFNRSMRALAKTKDMSLSEHALCSGVVRGSDGLKTGSGIVLSTPTEKDVFAHLGLPYREPYERDW